MMPQGPYNPTEYEKAILDFWLSNGYYKSEYNPTEDRIMSTEEMKADPREPWALICPPPNAYARPHIGNISGYAYQDAMARYARMRGKKVLVIPGKDHAGLEGEGVFVRDVLEKQGRNKFDMKREDFYKEMMEFFMKNIDIARNDEKAIGLSADFDRDIFTLDPRIVNTVLNTFIEMYSAGMIYKGVRIINWDPKARSAVADNQVDYKDSTTPFYYFKYAFGEPVKDALEIKDKYTDRIVQFNFERNKTKDGINYLPFAFGKTIDGYEVIGVGFKQDLATNVLQKGKAIGIMLRTNLPSRLIILSQDFADNLDNKLFEIFTFETKHYAGSHYILFENLHSDNDFKHGFIIGTVRPETVFADTAIACNSNDERYKDFIGKKIEVEFLGEKKFLNFIDDYTVDKDFGTGLLKITPAHSQEDWEIANRHKEKCLPAIQVIGYDLKLNHLTGKYSGMGIKESRIALKEDMKIHGNLIYVNENYANRIKIAERTGATIEPLMSSQWYLKYDTPENNIKQAALDMINNKKVIIHPENMVQKFDHWMNNLRDWAISRSLWWGYRLPVWYHGEIREAIDGNGQVKEEIKFSDQDNWTALEYGNPEHIKVQLESPGDSWHQDENVLDTWFSSGQWIYATLEAHNLKETFFPTNVLVSASDILENWDSRMMMFTHFHEKQNTKGSIPFRNLFLTGLVLGKDGQKMSKSKGNVMDVDQIKTQYGSDALRMAYFYQNSAGGSYVISDDKLKNFKNFNNKLWNAARFVLTNAEGLFVNPTIVQQPNHEFSRKLIEHISQVKTKVTKNIDSYEFGYATETLYDEFWHTFCDVLIEESKQYITKRDFKTGEIILKVDENIETEINSTMVYVLKEYLKMLHPFIPFITQMVWNEVPKNKAEHKVLMYTKY